MANEFGSLALLTKCYSAETTVEEVLVTDECGENAKLMTKNVTSNHEWEGQILGPSASGIAAGKVGASFAAPSGMWLDNMNNPGSANVLTSGRAQFNAGEYATFMGRITNREGI
jgi:hypothetical protein